MRFQPLTFLQFPTPRILVPLYSLACWCPFAPSLPEQVAEVRQVDEPPGPVEHGARQSCRMLRGRGVVVARWRYAVTAEDVAFVGPA